MGVILNLNKKLRNKSDAEKCECEFLTASDFRNVSVYEMVTLISVVILTWVVKPEVLVPLRRF